MATKSELVTILQNKYDQVDNGTLANDITKFNIKEYTYQCVEVGKTVEDNPMQTTHNVTIAVYDEGGGGESAYYKNGTLPNLVNNSLVGSSTSLLAHKIYADYEITNRISVLIGKAAKSILDEALASTNLLYDVSTGSNIVSVENRYSFYANKVVIINNGTDSEELTIDRVTTGSGDTGNLIMKTDLVNSYTVAQGTTITYKDNNERMLWAVDALTNRDMNTNEFFRMLVAWNPTVQANGRDTTDNDLEWIINGNITKIASTIY